MAYGPYANSAMNVAHHKIINIINRLFFFSEIHEDRGHMYVYQDTHRGQKNVRLPGTGVASVCKLPDLDAGSFLMEEQVL